MSGMSAEALLASLMAQAEGRGVDLITLQALVEESSQAGARRALWRTICEAPIAGPYRATARLRPTMRARRVAIEQTIHYMSIER